MHARDHDRLEPDSLRPKSSHIDDERPDAALFEAAAAGRADVLGVDGMLRMQRAAGNERAASLVEQERSPVLDVISSGGRELDEPVRADMEARFDTDFSDVRVHTDDRAHASAESVNAHAYTVGSNIVFQRDKFDPSSSEGQTMLAHELTHVVQQRSGPVDGTPTGTGVSVSDPSDRFEREAAANAEHIMAAPAATTAAAASASEGAAVQREAEPSTEEEEPVQGSFVQREAAPEEEPEEEPG